MWEERISVVQAFADAITERDVEAGLALCHPEVEFFSLLAQLEASPYRGFAGIRRYFKDLDATWAEWRVEVEQLVAAPDGRVAIVMSTHMRGTGSGLPFAERVANVWEFKDEKLWRATLDERERGTLAALMRDVVRTGTGVALADVAGEPAGKSGTAEFGGGDPPPTHAWFIAYRDDVAIAVLVEGGTSGASVAAPIASAFFAALDR
jgi:ketosteroid isomerase-like protein